MKMATSFCVILVIMRWMDEKRAQSEKRHRKIFLYAQNMSDCSFFINGKNKRLLFKYNKKTN